MISFIKVNILSAEILSLFIFFTNSFLCIGQDINGKWLQLQEENSITYPAVNIIELDGDSIYGYDFDKVYTKSSLRKESDKLIFMDSLEVVYRMNNYNELQIFGAERESMERPHRFVRIHPTKVYVEEDFDLEGNMFELLLSNEIKTFTIGKGKTGDFSYFSTSYVVADAISIEKRDKTYFLCLYFMKNRIRAFPIRELKHDLFIIYGIRGEKADVIAKKKNKP